MENIIKVLDFIPKELIKEISKEISKEINKEKEFLEEIRIRCNKPIFIRTNKRTFFLEERNIKSYEIKEIVQKLSGYSLYSFEQELSQGYFTITGGHRVGFCGQAIVENGKVKTLHQISSLNIRIAHNIINCSKNWLKYLFENDDNYKKTLCHTFIISPPACGKTTFLRDLIRQLSYENYTIGIVDERGEISPMKNGIPQMDLGNCVDVQEGCPKSLGMNFLLRSMNPEIIAVDELGKDEDFYAIEQLIYSGVSILATIHGYGNYEYINKKYIDKIFKGLKNGRIIFLSRKNGTGTVESIYSTKGKLLYKLE